MVCKDHHPIGLKHAMAFAKDSPKVVGELVRIAVLDFIGVAR
jgi:hypothetical protein